MKKITDKARLDFIQRHKLEVVCDKSEFAELDGESWCLSGPLSEWRPTLRKAIDSSIIRKREQDKQQAEYGL